MNRRSGHVVAANKCTSWQLLQGLTAPRASVIDKKHGRQAAGLLVGDSC